MAQFKPFNFYEAMSGGQNLAANQLKIDEATNTLRARSGLQQAISAGTPEALQAYRQRFPIEAMDYEKKLFERAKGVREQQKFNDEQRKANTEWLAGATDQVLKDPQSASFLIDEGKRRGIIDANFDGSNLDLSAVKELNRQAKIALGTMDPGALQEVYDETSPTGTRFVKRGDALGKPGKMPSGLDIEFGTDGKPIRITQGRGKSGMSPRTTGTVEDKILSAGDTMGQLRSIDRLYRPEFQQLGTRFSNLAARWKDKAGIDIPPDEKRLIEDFSKYRSEATQLFALTLKDLSGVAVNPTEFKRAEQWIPYPGTGLFDGDSPTELEAKRERLEDFTRRALIKYNYIRKNGLSINDIDVDQMPKIVQKRGDEIAKQLESRGLRGDQLKQEVKKALSDEFGLGLVQ